MQTIYQAPQQLPILSQFFSPAKPEPKKTGRPRGRSDRLPRLRRATSAELPGIELTSRDMSILETVYTYRALSSPQIATLLFAPTTKTWCDYRLKLLFHHGYLYRLEQPQLPSEKRKPYVYWLDRKGAEELATMREFSVKDLDWEGTERKVSYYFLEHMLAINNVRIAITKAAAIHDTMLEVWHDERTLKRSHKQDTITLTSSTGEQQTTTVIPDGYFLLDTGKRRYHRFLEIDRATETGKANGELKRDWARKIACYLEYYRAEHFQERYHSQGMVVLTITTSEKRLANLKRITEETSGRERFWFTTFERLRAPDTDILTAPIWNVATTEERRSIIL
jgi:Replication-relaxation